MLMFGYVRSLGALTHTDGMGKVSCFWATLRTKGMIIPRECEPLAIPADEKGNLRFVFTTTNMVENRLKSISREYVREYDAGGHTTLAKMEAWVYFPPILRIAFIFGYNEEDAARAAYDAGLRVPLVKAPPIPKDCFWELLVLQHRKQRRVGEWIEVME